MLPNSSLLQIQYCSNSTQGKSLIFAKQIHLPVVDDIIVLLKEGRVEKSPMVQMGLDKNIIIIMVETICLIA